MIFTDRNRFFLNKTRTFRPLLMIKRSITMYNISSLLKLINKLSIMYLFLKNSCFRHLINLWNKFFRLQFLSKKISICNRILLILKPRYLNQFLLRCLLWIYNSCFSLTFYLTNIVHFIYQLYLSKIQYYVINYEINHLYLYSQELRASYISDIYFWDVYVNMLTTICRLRPSSFYSFMSER